MKEDILLLQKAVEAKPQLCSIFDRINPNGDPPSHKRSPLTASILTGKNIVSSEGGLLPEALKNELTRLSELHQDAQTDTYFYLLQKYGWRIGRSDGIQDELQDVSVCDALRTERALEQKGGNGGYLLIKGDLSGIQEYIYGNIQQKTAGGLAKLAKRLRGRSILVTLLTDFLANVTLRELNLPVWNLLFAGGGHFNLLLPDTPTTRDSLEKLMARLDAEMRSVFGDRLHLVLAQVECTEKQITEQAGLCFERLNVERERKKYRQHKGMLSTHFYAKEPETEEKKKKRDDIETEIGRSFPSQNILVESVGGLFQTGGKTQELVTLKMENQTYSLLSFENLKDAEDGLFNVPGMVSAQIFTLNKTSFLPKKEDWIGKITQPVGFGFRFLGKHVPFLDALNPKNGRFESRPKTFEEIAKTDALEMLGVIRLDVDDLGYIFSHGMHGATLGRIVTLSREMHYFFSAHFDQLAEKYQLYLIYSGGDDAFAVGQWKNLIEFARELQSDFQKFIFRNKSVHFSAGIFLCDPKYPVGRLFLDAGALLDEAKDGEEKDRINIFYRVTRWDTFDKKIKFGTDLSAMLKKDGDTENRKLSMAFAYRLLTLAKTSFYERTEIVNGLKVKRGTLNPRRFAHNISGMRYLFARNGYDKAKTEEVLKGVEHELITDFFRNFNFGVNNEQSIQDNIVALNYALYTIRSQKNAEQ
jgi:CRISPR-associated protein Csm1